MSNSRLFQPLRVGSIELKHRIAMAPLTRFRNSDDFVPQEVAKTYYGQRAAVPGTFLISEATIVSPRGIGQPNMPGIWTDKHIEAWKQVTDEVHRRGSHIYLQIFALGRAATTSLCRTNGVDVVSSSAVQLDDDHEKPRALEGHEIKAFVSDFAQAGRNAITAGFDGIEIHAANGYLIDQFNQDTANNRTDEYGGSVENRSRFALEVTKAIADAIGSERVGIRVSPWSTFQGMKMSDPVPQFTHLVQELSKLNLAYLHLVESRIAGSSDVESHETLDPFISAWGKEKPVFIAGGFDDESGKALVDRTYKDANVVVVFGRYFISNPDLPFRIKNGVSLTKYQRDTFYTHGTEGYIDYPYSEEFQRQQTVAA